MLLYIQRKKFNCVCINGWTNFYSNSILIAVFINKNMSKKIIIISK